MKPSVRWLVAGLAFGAAFLWLALRHTDPAQALAALARADWRLGLATLLAGLGFMTFKGLRWSVLLRRVAPVDAGLLHRTLYIGAAANLVFAHVGELLRATLLARRSGAGASAVLATVAIERIFDVAALVVLNALAIALDPRVSAKLGTAGLVGAAIVIAGVVGALLLLRPAPWMTRIGRALLAPLPLRSRDWLIDQIHRSRTGLAALVDPVAAAQAGLLSLLQWGCIVGAIWASSAAIGEPVAPTGALAVFVLMVLALMLPSPPAQIGTTQLAYVVGFGLVGTGADTAVAASLIYTGLVILPVMIIGGLLALSTDWREPAPGRGGHAG